GSPLPILLRPEGAGPQGDLRWQEHARGGQAIRRACRRATGVVAIAPPVRDELLAAGFDESKIFDIPNGVEIPDHTSAPVRARPRAELAESDPRLQIAPAAPLVLYVGRLHKEKGLDELLEAWTHVVAAERQARLWIVGDGPYLRPLAAKINALQLMGSVTLAGSYDSTSQFYQAANVFAFPSRSELMPLALLEAMAAPLRIVASDIAGNRHLLDDGQCGLLVPVGHVQELADGIVSQLERPDDVSPLAVAARERVRVRFSLAGMTRMHWRLFQQMIDHS
ncbi:MAG: glycosyltransferase, partial [Planctomycetales bacterium]|nr:glycosyltransferase [Planctomycetales bacterium]